jgi:hypothetical protein
MTENLKETSDARHDLLDSINGQYETIPTFEACLNAHGMYETMRFVLRLSPRNHELMETIEADGFESGPISSETIQAYSTYIHETIHWWQHVGSTSGLLFSLSYLAQSHSSMEQLREVLTTFGPKKSLKGWADKVLLKEGDSAQAKLASANIAVNNALDVEYYKAYAYDPRASIKWMIDQNHFESVGHTYFIVYGQLVGLIGDVIDPELSALPKITGWDVEIRRLNSEKVEGYYWRSPVRLPCTEWRQMGYLSGIYFEAFDAFLRLSESEWPDQMSDPIIGLFLLVCDLAINPTRGMPLDIDSFEDFILDVDVGIRFTRLSLAVKALPHLKTAVKHFSREEYIAISNDLIGETGYDHPLSGLQAVMQWGETALGLAKLMEEHRTFEFERTNLPIRVFVSHFVAFCTDKFETPEFFCWPGKYMSGGGGEKNVRELWLRHLSLFSDRGDKNGVYPRRWPNRSEAAVMKTFNRFYGTMTLYDLTRQWILKDGPFVYDYRWLSENYSQKHADAWANDTFKQIYGVTLDEFEIVQ